jgi:hypothetical protein
MIHSKKLVLYLLLEVVSKPQIRFEGKAQADEIAQHTEVCAHIEEACNAAIGPQMGF